MGTISKGINVGLSDPGIKAKRLKVHLVMNASEKNVSVECRADLYIVVFSCEIRTMAAMSLLHSVLVNLCLSATT